MLSAARSSCASFAGTLVADRVRNSKRTRFASPQHLVRNSLCLGSTPRRLHQARGVRGQRAVVLCSAADPGEPDTSGMLSKQTIESKSPTGQYLQFIREQQPHLFEGAVEEQLGLLAASKEEDGPGSESTDVVLYKRINEVKDKERSKAVQDVMYNLILFSFGKLGLTLAGPEELHGVVNLGSTDLNMLTKGIHSLEALDLVRNHLKGLLGQMPDNELGMHTAAVKLSKLQGAQVYAASMMFGYFLRRVDQRFQLEKSMGTLEYRPTSREDTIEMLENLFKSAESIDDAADPDAAPEIESKRRPTLREYVESFDQATMIETASVMSMEGVMLLQEYTTELYGDLNVLQRQMSDAVGNVDSPEAFMEKMKEVIQEDEVETLVMTFADQRRLVLEAVAFGTFLRDSEDYIEDKASVPLFTPAPRPPMPPQSGGGGEGGGTGLLE
mmetsp:Transcript_13409/g.48794  ORF Transcript_13409/g.48794 Transcript_13409/m.48794 type:complete len:442 (-) Transcript_13409:104-1429(-)